jgi:uncharacterized Zn finger protein (UPF0148 family)
MMNEELQGLLCPHCGVVFFADHCGTYRRCPVCGRRFRKTSCELIEASLETE